MRSGEGGRPDECHLDPQTNIVFELVPSTDLDVDHNDPKTREELEKAYGMKTPATFSAESTVWADKNSGWFAKHKVPGSHMTFFVVHKLHSGGDPVYGKGGEYAERHHESPDGRLVHRRQRLPSTFAHEAGHCVGDMSHKGEDTKLLMRGEGAGYKIPFELAKSSESPSPGAADSFVNGPDQAVRPGRCRGPCWNLLHRSHGEWTAVVRQRTDLLNSPSI